MAIASPSLRRITRMNLALGGVLVIAGALTQPKPMALGVAVGVALTCLNFFVLARLVKRWTADAARGGTKPSSSSYLMMPKMVILMLAVVAALEFLPIDPIGFVVGYSTFVLSIMIEAVYSNMIPPPADTTDTTGTGASTDG